MTITAPGGHGSSFRAGVSAWHCPVSHNPTVRRAKGSKIPGMLSDCTKSTSAIAQLNLNFAACRAVSEGRIGLSV